MCACAAPKDMVDVSILTILGKKGRERLTWAVPARGDCRGGLESGRGLLLPISTIAARQIVGGREGESRGEGIDFVH